MRPPLSELGVIVPIPLAVGVAIVSHRLYDIDRLINRTLVYGLLTALLARSTPEWSCSLPSCLVGSAPNRQADGRRRHPAVAALFQPARRSIQQAVDRRFNRPKYDAAKTIERFSGRLRDELDLHTLSGELLAMIDQTMPPTSASL